MKKMLVAILPLIISCNFDRNKLIFYSYNGVNITRSDQSAKSKFYYGIHTPKELDTIKSYIEADYSGFNNNLDLYLIFKQDKTIELIHFGGEYLSVQGKHNNSLYFSNYENEILYSVLSSYKKTDVGMIRVSGIIELEKKNTKEENSKVNVKYP